MTRHFPVTIYHNPDCGTSRNVLAAIKASGYAPVIVDYRAEGWTRPLLEELLAAMRLRASDILRQKGTPAATLGLLDPGTSDAAILDAMMVHPILVNRPIVTTPIGTRLCRPSETVLDLLVRVPQSFTREDGVQVHR